MNNIVVYRVETLICALSLTRLYLIWRAFADYMLQDLPSRDSISAYTGVNFNSTFVLKRMLNSWMAIFWISIFYLVVVLVGGYLFRIAEHMHSCLFEVRLALLFSVLASCLRSMALRSAGYLFLANIAAVCASIQVTTTVVCRTHESG